MRSSILGILVSLGLVGCFESENELLKRVEIGLHEQVEVLSQEANKYHQQCIDITNEYKKSATKVFNDTEELAENGLEICQNAIDTKNKVLELKKEIIDIQTIINKESRG